MIYDLSKRLKNYHTLGREVKPNDENIDKLDFIKIKNLCASKDTIKMKRKPTECEKIFAIYLSD